MTLRVTLEIVPFGDEDKKRKIRQLDIFNMGYIDRGYCEYGVIEIDSENNTGGLYEKTIYHVRDQGALVLVQRILDELILPDNT